MAQSPDITRLAQAMLIIQQQLQPAIKDAKNPFIGNEYATLNSVMNSCAAFFPLKVSGLLNSLVLLLQNSGQGILDWKHGSYTLSLVSGFPIQLSSPYRKAIRRKWAALSPMPGGLLCAPSSVS